MQYNTAITFEQLMASLEDAKSNPIEACWQIYHYLKAHFKDDGSVQSRTLLMAYLRICPKESGRLHSCFLQMSCMMSQEFADFKFPEFLKCWGYPNMLTKEDSAPQVGKDGRQYISLRQRTDMRLMSYMLHNPASRTEENYQMLDSVEPMRIMQLLAVKVFETERAGRKMRSVKLIGQQGKEFLADSHTLPCKPWEIQGRMFDAVIRVSREGTPRIHEAVLSQQPVTDVFPAVTGYVDHYDADHNHYHVFDNLSRHFVAENPFVKPVVGGFVSFSPIIPIADKFKSAVIHEILPDGSESFGLLDGVVKYINKEKNYFQYELTSMPQETPEGTVTKEGFADLELLRSCNAEEKPQLPIRLLLFLKRGKDGKKRNHVARVYLPR